MSINNQNQVLTNTIKLPSVSELILSNPELQSEFSSEFFGKLNLPQVSLGSEISISAGSRDLTIKLTSTFANEVVRPFAYFLNEDDKVVVLSYASKGETSDLMTIVEGQEESMYSGILVQLGKLHNHPEFVKFLNYSESTLLNTDFRSENSENIEGAQEFEIRCGVRSFKFNGKLISNAATEDHYDIYVNEKTLPYIHDKKSNSFMINMEKLKI